MQQMTLTPQARPRSAGSLHCAAPWTDMVAADFDRGVTQCCPDWTYGIRGHLADQTLLQIWNGEGFRAARRHMAQGATSALCRAVCPVSQMAAEDRGFRSHGGRAPAFLHNQRLIEEDFRQGREVVRGLPTRLCLGPSTFCNYNCIMCDHGRTPVRDIPDAAWDELPQFLPALHTLILVGGEPLANPRVLRFMNDFDSARWPDLRLSINTNGSLVGPKTLRAMERCAFTDITVSLNAGTAEVYEQVQRGIPFDTVLEKLDALVAFRDRHPTPFSVGACFAIQTANAHTLIPFGELCLARGIDVRLLSLLENDHHSVRLYADPEAVARVLGHVDAFSAWAARKAPAWTREIAAVRRAIAAEASAQAAPPTGPREA